MVADGRWSKSIVRVAASSDLLQYEQYNGRAFVSSSVHPQRWQDSPVSPNHSHSDYILMVMERGKLFGLCFLPHSSGLS